MSTNNIAVEWKPGEFYEAEIIDFAMYMLGTFFPMLEIIDTAQKWLIEQLLLKDGPFVIRHSQDIRKIVYSRQGSSKPRYYFSSDFGNLNIEFDIIASDNESTSSFYTILLNRDTSFLKLSMKEMLQSKIFIGILRKEITPAIELGILNSFKTGMNNYAKKPSRSHLKLCHIIDVGQNLEAVISNEQLLMRSFICLNPLNIFPFPSSQKYEHYLEGVPHKDLGENKDFQELFEALMILHIYEQLGVADSDLIVDYYRFLNKTMPSLQECRETIKRFKGKVVSFKPKRRKSNLLNVSADSISIQSSSDIEKELSPKSRLKFNLLEIEGLSNEQVVKFRIKASEGKYKSDPRHIDGLFTCKVGEIKKFFDWNRDKNWINQGTHFWSRFPNWGKNYFTGHLGDDYLK